MSVKDQWSRALLERYRLEAGLARDDVGQAVLLALEQLEVVDERLRSQDPAIAAWPADAAA
jgi:hypothetical protein